MAKESKKAQKRTYTSPQVRNVVSNRTMANVAGTGQKFQAQAGILSRAGNMRDMLNYGLNGRNESYFRNRERISRAESNMLRRVNRM